MRIAAVLLLLILTCLAGLVTACGLLPWVTRNPPAEECGHLQGAEIIWAGYGDPVALGVLQPQPGVELGSGEIWVTEPVVPRGDQDADEGEFLPAFCYIGPPDEFGPVIGGGNVPAGWQPP